MPASRIYVER